MSRNVPPIETGVVSVTSICGGTAFNVIPEEVILRGTYRYFNPEIGEMLIRRMDELLKGISFAHSASSTLHIREMLIIHEHQ